MHASFSTVNNLFLQDVKELEAKEMQASDPYRKVNSGLCV